MLPLNIIIVEKSGSLKLLSIKDFKEEELFKKCGFKKADDFIEQVEWKVKLPNETKKYHIKVYGKTEGRGNYENKYDFPPPIDNKLFFGNCAIIAYFKNNDDTTSFTNLSLAVWEKIYEKLFGGFEDLASSAIEDEEEEDELANVPKEKKTKHGYLKDGFVVDSSDTDNEEDIDDEDSYETTDEDNEDKNEDIEIEDIGSELSEEEYDYSEEDEK
jgi:hypothetical protein